MIDLEIRAQLVRVLNLQHRRLLRALSLTKKEYALLQHILHAGPATSAKASSVIDTTPQIASMVLLNLMRKGYLTRAELPNPTGGTMFEYSPKTTEL